MQCPVRTVVPDTLLFLFMLRFPSVGPVALPPARDSSRLPNTRATKVNQLISYVLIVGSLHRSQDGCQQDCKSQQAIYDIKEHSSFSRVSSAALQIHI